MQTDIRNCISAKSVDDLLMIKLNGPSLMNFNQEKAIKLWRCNVASGGRINL